MFVNGKKRQQARECRSPFNAFNEAFDLEFYEKMSEVSRINLELTWNLSI